MNRPLLVKLGRELWGIRGQAAAIAAVIGAGIALFVLMISTYQSLDLTERTYYRRYRFAEVFASLNRAPLALERRIAEIPGVERVETRVVRDVLLDVPGVVEPAEGRLISIPADRRPVLNDLFLRAGRWIEPGRRDEVLISGAFAKAHHMAPGDRLAAIVNGRRRELRIVGIALSPEYVYSIRAGEILPDDRRFAVIWMERRGLAAAFDMEGAFDDVALTLVPRGLGAGRDLAARPPAEALRRPGRDPAPAADLALVPGERAGVAALDRRHHADRLPRGRGVPAQRRAGPDRRRTARPDRDPEGDGLRRPQRRAALPAVGAGGRPGGRRGGSRRGSVAGRRDDPDVHELLLLPDPALPAGARGGARGARRGAGRRGGRRPRSGAPGDRAAAGRGAATGAAGDVPAWRAGPAALAPPADPADAHPAAQPAPAPGTRRSFGARDRLRRGAADRRRLHPGLDDRGDARHLPGRAAIRRDGHLRPAALGLGARRGDALARRARRGAVPRRAGAPERRAPLAPDGAHGAAAGRGAEPDRRRRPPGGRGPAARAGAVEGAGGSARRPGRRPGHGGGPGGAAPGAHRCR